MIYLRLYADCLRRAAQGALKSRWTLALPMIYLAILIGTALLVSGLGILGSFILGIVADLCASSLLFFVAQAVLGTPSKPAELKRSFVEYFWPVVSFGFVVWIVTRILGYALAGNPQGAKIQLGIWAVAAVLLNAVPEVIYQKSKVGGLAIIVESANFIQKYWIEWFIPNVLLGAAIYFIVGGLLRLPFGIFLLPPIVGALTYVMATFRGNLFHLLDTTSPFQLRLRYQKWS